MSVSLTLRSLLKSAVSRVSPLQTSDRGAVVSGPTPSAKALLVAGLAPAEAVSFVVTPSDADVEQLSADIRFFLAALEGLTESDAEQAVLPFPSHEVDPYRGLAPHFKVAAARARALHAMAAGTTRVVVASAAALLPRVSDPSRLLDASVELRPGMDIDPHHLAAVLADAGFTREDPVDEHGEFCVRGGVVDIFPAADVQPVRLEFVGDTIEAVRRYDPATQRSIGALDQVTIVPLREVFPAGEGGIDQSATIFDYVAAASQPAYFVSEDEEVKKHARAFLDQVAASYDEASSRAAAPEAQAVPTPQSLLVDWAEVEARLAHGVVLDELALEEAEPEEARSQRHVACQPAVEFRGRLQDWIAEVRRRREQAETVLFVAAAPGRAERIIELLADYELRGALVERAEDLRGAAVLVATGRLSRGFRLPEAALQIYAETDVFEEERRLAERRRSVSKAFVSDLRDLKVGDLIVHVDHGIGVFVGLKQITVSPGEAPHEFLELRYAGDDKLFVPVERLDLVQKYTGATKPPLDRLGGTSWEKAKTRVKKAMRDMAEELLKLYAARKAIQGHAFATDTHWQEEFEAAFPYELTPDQEVAIAEIKKDLESPAPMDRLLCGDVGFGKTEVAMRAAFKAVMEAKQVAVLAPTTVLTFQHLTTLRDRFAGFPVNVEMISRFRNRAEQKQIVTDLAAGKVDIIVGTHRLLSKDVEFRDLGLLVVDEEQRFGVAHKERIKQLRRKVDVLTMTATPIPRTLNMSLVGIRDMSIIETPPRDRLAIQTNVVKFDQRVITRALTNELERGGQVYFVHNRVESIFSIGHLLVRLVPQARLVVAHGQMGEDELERAMVDFVAHKYDVLLATTIIENGLDIPNVNTIVINRADRYGLAQLYQLRGRVGRSDRPAYAYLLIPPEDALSQVAKKRLAAIREFSDLGSGFRVAALDLEIRGAGNLLGGEQSGHIDAVGFEMYMKLLEQTVRELKGEDVELEARATVNLGIDLRIDEAYVPDMNQRLMLYRKVASARTDAEVDRLLEEARDRYGPTPDSVLNLADYGRIRVLADRLGLEAVDRQGSAVVFRFREERGESSRTRAALDPMRLVRLVNARPDLSLIPPASLKLDLRVSPDAGRHAPAHPTARGKWGAMTSGGPPPRRAGRLRSVEDEAAASWWTARATAGEVTPGFTKEAILKPSAEDPRAPNGVFMRVGRLLSELAGTG
ncbi:MAG: transcription-repair coupling factor [Acidobacteria bacterium]|nr:transcription-repair coupling factor [Acidobacteriota bacterium]